MREVTINDLPDLTGKPLHPPPVLLCDGCGEQYSANQGDYLPHGDWYAGPEPDTVLRCCQCDCLLRLVVMRQIAEDWAEDRRTA